MAAEVAVYNKAFKQDLNEPVKVHYGGGVMFTGDSLADTIIVSVTKNGEPFELSGTSVTLKCIRADGITEPVAGGFSGNVAWGTLTQACLAVPGAVTCSLCITNGAVTTTLLQVVYDALPTETGTSGDPGTIILDVAALIDAIETAVGSIPADYSGLLHTITGDFSATKQYHAGDYAWYNGTLYRFAADHLGTWAATDAKAAVIGDDIAEVNSQITKYNAFNLVEDLLPVSKSTTASGITWAWTNRQCHVSGTATGASLERIFWIDGTQMPPYFEAGKTYRYKFTSTGDKVRFRARDYVNGTGQSFTDLAPGTGIITIGSNTNGMQLTFVVPSTAGTVDETIGLEILGAETTAEIAERIDAISAVNLEQGRYIIPTYCNTSSTMLQSNELRFDNRFIRITVKAGYTGSVSWTTQGGASASRNLAAGQHFFYGGAEIPVSFTLKRNDNTLIDPSEGIKNLAIEYYDEGKTEILNGIYRYNIEWDKGAGISSSYLFYYDSPTRYASAPIKIPKGGLRLAFNPKYHTTEYIQDYRVDPSDPESERITLELVPYNKVVAVKKTDNGLQLITSEDEPGLYAMSATNTFINESFFIPYVEDTYVIVLMYDRSESGIDIDLDEYQDYIQITGGQMGCSGGLMTNIFPTAVALNQSETANVLDIKAKEDRWYMVTSSLYYGTIVRLGDVRRIVASPEYTLIAEVCKLTKDGLLQRVDEVWGNYPMYSTSAKYISGVTEIDFSELDYDGYALIGIQSTAQLIQNAAPSTGYSVRHLSMGQLGGYDDVMEKIFIEYKNNVNISYKPGLPGILAENIRWLSQWRVAEYGWGWYVEERERTRHRFDTQYNVVPSFYSGTFHANTLLMHVTAKSALTAIKNPNGRMRKFARNNGDLGRIGYGMTCTNFTSIIFGLRENYPNHAFALGDNTKFERHEFDYTTDLDELMPGDILSQYEIRDNGTYAGHCMTVTSIVQRNGHVAAVNVIEAWPPYNRYRTFLDMTYYENVQTGNWIAKIYTISELAHYRYRNRIKPEYINRIIDTFDMWPEDTSVKNVMCDRGTDSIYCTSTPYVMLSVSDETAGELVLYNGSTYAGTITIDDITPTENGLKVVNAASMIQNAGEGLYTVRIGQSDEVQERFYVKGDETFTVTEGENEILIAAPKAENIVWIEVAYRYPVPDTSGVRGLCIYVPADMTINDSTHTATLTVPRERNVSYQGEQNVESYDRSVRIIYQTQYGTYWVSATWSSNDNNYKFVTSSEYGANE